MTIQGGGAVRSQGDYVAAATGLDTYYSVFFEVPPALPLFQVDLFDADIGAGGAGEAGAGRDRDRSGYNTTATYTMFAPNGGAVSTRFATGSTTLPAGADNAWLAFFSSTGTFRDEFGSVAYNNNNGTNPWSTSWTESGDDGFPNSGEVLIVNDGGSGRLRVENAGRIIEREVNLNGVATATLSFVYRRSSLDNLNDYVAIEVSANGGGSWTELDRFAGPAAGPPVTDAGYTAVSYDISTAIASNTRIRFRSPLTLGNNDLVYFDNVQIAFSNPVPGHWEARLDQSDSGGDDINAVGVRGHDGDATSGGTEIPAYLHSFGTYGTNNPPATRQYTQYPWITSGCLAESNDFDWDSNSAATGSLVYTSRTGAFVQTIATLSANDAWRNVNIGGWTSDADGTDYGIWAMDVTINDYPGNANYGQVYVGNSFSVTPPTTQPQANTFRIYLPTDAGAAPAKPYLEQLVRHGSGTGVGGPNPPVVGQTSTFTVTVRLVNPTTRPIVFSTPSNVVTANVPGLGVTYAGLAQVSQGSIVSQPSVGGTGNVTWNPGTVAAGTTALLAYRVSVTPVAPGQRLPVTGTPLLNGTRAQYLDETAASAQARATYLQGPLCELAVTVGALTPAVVSSFRARPAEAGGAVVEWTTAGELGTSGFRLYRRDPSAGGRWTPVHDGVLAAVPGADQGSTWRFHDRGAAPGSGLVYLLEEVTPGGAGQRFGPFRAAAGGSRAGDAPVAVEAALAVTPHGDSAVPAESGEAARAGRRAIAAADRAPGTSRNLHVSVGEPGVVRLGVEEISAATGQKANQVAQALDKGKLALSRDGAATPWWVERTASREPAALLFHAELPDSLYTRDAVFRLDFDARGTTPGGTAPPAAAAGAPAATLAAAHRREVDRLAATVVATDSESDYWFWEFLVGGDPTFGVRSFALDAPAVAGGPAELRVALHGATTTGVAGEHVVAVRLDGRQVGEVVFDGIGPAAGSFAVELDPAGANLVELVASAGGGAPYSIVYLDSFALTYRRQPIAQADTAAFTGEGSAVAIGGFSGLPIHLLDVTPGQPPRLVGAATAEPEPGGTYRLRFQAESGRRYVASGPRAMRGAALRPWKSVGRSNATYLALAAPGLVDAAGALAALRRAQGLSAAVVDLEAVGDAWGDGVVTPQAIRRFLADTARQGPRRRYLALVGAGSWDYRDLLGHGGNLVPPQMVATASGLFPSDSRLADLDGDGVPELAVGRIPVATPAELLAFVDKLAAYEAAAGDWAGRALLLSDTPAANPPFGLDSARLASRLGGTYEVESIDLGSEPVAAARARLQTELAAGAAWVNYYGHGGLDRLGSAGLLTSADVPALANGARLPVLTAMTCTVNRFAVPGVPALGQLLVNQPGGGAVAVFSPSGLAYHESSRGLAEALYAHVAANRGGRLGDLTQLSLVEWLLSGGDRELFDLYTLLGDPATRLHPVPPRSGYDSQPAGVE